MENKDTGLLLDKQNILLQRRFFEEMVRLKGVNVIYREPTKGKTYDGHGELDSFYEPGIVVGCLFEEKPKQKTMKKLGWVTEVNESRSIISVSYDLKGLQVGGLFLIPSPFDDTEARVFKIIDISAIPVYPASITCELGPMFENTQEKSEIHDFTHSNFNLLREEND